MVHSDFDDYISMNTTTRTPDVPSGGVFSVKTRTCVTWASSASARVVVTTQVEWMGRSFIRCDAVSIPSPVLGSLSTRSAPKIIEKSAIDGQKTYQSELSRAMRTYIQERQSKFIPASLDPTAVAVAVQDPSSSSSSSSPAMAAATGGAQGKGVDDAAPPMRASRIWTAAGCSGRTTRSRARRPSRGSPPQAPSSYSVMRGSPSSPAQLHFLIVIIVPVDIDGPLRRHCSPGAKRDERKEPRLRLVEEREKWVKGIVAALWQELEAGHHQLGGGAASSSSGAAGNRAALQASNGFQSPPVVPPDKQLPNPLARGSCGARAGIGYRGGARARCSGRTLAVSPSRFLTEVL